MLRLQRTVGNRATTQLLARHNNPPAPRAANGLPEHLAAGLEQLSGLSMDAVRVHYNSPRPVRLSALAYADGSDIHVAPGQEQHLPHEAWHVVQQAQGRVAGTRRLAQGAVINDNQGLEREADVMGARAAQLKTPASEAGGTRLTTTRGVVQRRVTINGAPIESIVDYLHQNELLEQLSHEEAGAAGWMIGLSPTWNFSRPTVLLKFVKHVAAMAKLLRSIFANGILSRTRLEASRINYTGSIDSGAHGDLAVNILDNRARERDAGAIANESMTAENRGSISVALERRDDPLRAVLTRPDAVQVPDEDVAAEASAKNVPPALHGFLRRQMQADRAHEQNRLLLGGRRNATLGIRALTTVMAVVPRPHEREFTVLSPRSGSYESTATSGRIASGGAGFSTLLVPLWFEPFFLMLRESVPHGVEVKFVGTTRVTANFKTREGQIPVSVNAPDYASEVGPLLTRFGLLATHILTA